MLGDVRGEFPVDLDVRLVTVFPDGPGGGNPAPIVLDAAGLDDASMQALARSYGHESAFVVDPSGTGCDLALRFWVPNHEMSMCGHATVGTTWLLAHLGRLPRPGEVRVHTASGVVRARVDAAGNVTVSQPAGRVEPVGDTDGVLDARGAGRAQQAGEIVNATTSRTKTLVPLVDVRTLDALHPDPDRIDEACAAIGSTGLYPYVRTGDRSVEARQFPRAAGYPEDPATGVAAAALAFGLLHEGTITGVITPDGGPLTIRQGRAMGRPSVIEVRFETAAGQVRGCWLGGPVVLGAT